jgi:ABC-type branched-subunit amino acid transport system permease subunit
LPDLNTFLQQSFNGASISAIYLLVALGITLAFGLTNIANFAHGQFMLLGGFFALSATEHGVPLARRDGRGGVGQPGRRAFRFPLHAGQPDERFCGLAWNVDRDRIVDRQGLGA